MSTISINYAKALFRASTKSGHTDTISREIKHLKDWLQNNANMSETVANPFISRDEKEDLLCSQVKSNESRNLIKEAIHHNRGRQFADILGEAAKLLSGERELVVVRSKMVFPYCFKL
jgi:F0F1-type ATP synthase delta subunit